ncbi:MAG TPA: NUDIX hydrolase [Marinagarivorans sp.]
MTSRAWNPHVTVATVVAREDRYLLVHERAEGNEVYNQPAGHLENGESLIQAAIRETLEETGWHVSIQALLGISRYVAPTNGETYIRFSFIAQAESLQPNATLDDGILAARWLTKAQIIDLKDALRSPLILNDIARFERGERLPLNALYDHPEN